MPQPSRHRRPVQTVLAPFSRADWPLALLAAAACASPLLVLDQGGDWHTALLSFLVVLGIPGAAVEAMVGVARLALWIGEGGRR